MTDILFSELGLSEKTLAQIEKKGYKNPSPIQAWVIPLLLKGDKDIIGQAATGTGKTAAFGLPLIDKIDTSKRGIKAIVLAPTRELAIQVADEIKSFTNDSKLKVSLLYGGRFIGKQLQELKDQPQIIVGTPWRVRDHLDRGSLKLDDLEYFILDEADEMLNIGFREEIEEIFEKTPINKRVLLFSATMPQEILNIAKNYMGDYELVSIKAAKSTSVNVEQCYYEVKESDKLEVLTRVIETTQDFYSIIFCRTKSDVDELAANLVSRGYIAEWIHGDIEQFQREKILWRFKTKKTRILVATDVAARGIDVEDLTHVVNYGIPEGPETYTHRIWRTGRAGKKWIAITFVTRAEYRRLSFIERVTKTTIEKGQIPKIDDVLKYKKVRFIDTIKSEIGKVDMSEIQDIIDQLNELSEDKNQIIAAILKKSYNNEFSKKQYKDIELGSSVRERSDRPERSSVPSTHQRLFIARGRKDNLDISGIKSMIEGDVGISLSGETIEVMENFSFMNCEISQADTVLRFYKAQNSNQPVIVQAKSKDAGGSRGWFGGWDRGWYRGWNGWSRGWFGGWDRGWYRGGNGGSRGWFGWWDRGGYRGWERSASSERSGSSDRSGSGERRSYGWPRRDSSAGSSSGYRGNRNK